MINHSNTKITVTLKLQNSGTNNFISAYWIYAYREENCTETDQMRNCFIRIIVNKSSCAAIAVFMKIA